MLRLHPALTANTGFLMRKVSAASFEGFASIAGRHGLHPMHFGLLSIVAAEAPVSQQELGALLGVDPSTMVARMDVLEERGLVERRRRADDRRTYEIRLTPAGEETLTALRREAAAYAKRFFRALSAEEREQLHEIMLKLAATVDEDEAAAAAEVSSR